MTTHVSHMSHMLRKKNSREIILHTESQFYLPGDEIVGTVTYHPKKAVSLRFVRVIFAGEEFCIWIDKATRVGGPIAASRAPLFRKETTLLNDRTRIEPGPHTWQFRFYVPRSIPPTCNYNAKASICYWLKAKAATSFGHFDARFRYPITIGQFWVPTVPAPIQTTHNLSGGSIAMSVKSSHSVIKCGDSMTLNVHFENTSFRNLTGVRVKLKQVWECTGVFYHKNIVLKHFTKEGFPTSRGPHTTIIQIKVPNRLQTCPTVSNASLFKCTYYLGVYGISKMAGGIHASDTIKCRLPITVSNLPTAENEQEVNSNPAILDSLSDNSDSESDSDSGPSNRSSNNSLPSNLSRDSSASDIGSNLNSQGNVQSNSFNDFSRDFGLNTLFNLDINDNETSKSDLKLKSKEVEETTTTQKEPSHNEDDSPSKECIVCYDGAKNMLLLPCAHICTCVSCTSYIMYSNKQCPVCRTKIQQVMRIYPV